jgi:hypothetical protein
MLVGHQTGSDPSIEDRAILADHVDIRDAQWKQ